MKLIRVVDNETKCSSEPLFCGKCKNDSFNLNKSENGSLVISCNKCGNSMTFGSSMDIKGLIGLLKKSYEIGKDY